MIKAHIFIVYNTTYKKFFFTHEIIIIFYKYKIFYDVYHPKLENGRKTDDPNDYLHTCFIKTSMFVH